jgi:histidine ammonia-lyase
MSLIHNIEPGNISIDKVFEIIENNVEIQLSASAVEAVKKGRTFLDNTLENEHKTFYGINTGFGSLCNVEISKNQIKDLQKNLVMSHACGVGEKIDPKIVRVMMLLKIQSLAYGHSGITLQTLQRLIDLFNRQIVPVVYEMGSLGASGDLAPLAHLSLPLLGLGEVYFRGKIRETKTVYRDLKWEPIELQAKEGLALLNGTQFMSAFGTTILYRAKKLMEKTHLISSLSLDAYQCKSEPFEDPIHQIRNHPGQIETAKRIREILSDSEIFHSQKEHVQDPYSYRCIPQVHGATMDAIDYVQSVFEREISGVTDNPNIFADEGLILSGGNFHGQPLALTLDYLAMALAEMGNISERRVYCLVSGQRGLPPFLVKNPGLNSGFMIPQYTAASIVSRNKQLTVPASTDSITSSNGQEDHVSMGANAATKCFDILQNLEQIMAIELLTAAQAFAFRDKPTSIPVMQLMENFRQHVPFMENDRELYRDIQKALVFLREEI